MFLKFNFLGNWLLIILISKFFDISYNLIKKQGEYYLEKQGIQERSSFSEELMRVYMRYIFDASFDKAHPDWLKGKGRRGGDLELDGYNKKLGIAFELDGPYHYDVDFVMRKHFVSRAEATKIVRAQQTNDGIKNNECKTHKPNEVILIRLRIDRVPFSGFQRFIEDEYESLTGIRIRKPSLDYRKAVRLIRSHFLRLDFFLR